MFCLKFRKLIRKLAFKMEDLKQQGVNNDQGNNHMNLYSYENLHGSFNFNGDDYFKQSDCKRSNYSTTLIEFINSKFLLPLSWHTCNT